MTLRTSSNGHKKIPLAHGLRPRFQQTPAAGYPPLRDLYAILSMTLTVVIMAFSSLYGTYPILLFYALWLPHTLHKGRFILRPTPDIALPILFGLLALASVGWSDYPAVTLRGALEFISMIACTIIMARIVNIKTLCKGIILGTAAVMAITLIDGGYGTDAFSGTYALVGPFGSKNQVGLFAEIGLLTSIVLLAGHLRRREKFFYCFCPSILYALCLYLSRSGGAVATLVLVLLATYAIYRVARFSPRNRRFIFLLVIFFAALAAAAMFSTGGSDAILKLMGKDSTLTGRTYLWAEGIKNGLKNPILGDGYSAFWTMGRIAAEHYWFKFGINNRSGFHFHNLYVQTFVDLGGVGLMLMLSMTIANCTKSLRYAMRHGLDLRAAFCTSVAFLFAVRAFVEVDFLGPFSIGCLLFYSILPLLAVKPTAKTA